MLSFSKGRPFAVLVHKYGGEERKLYIHDGMDDIDKKLLKGLTREEKKVLKQAVMEGEPEFLSPKLRKIWKEVGGGDIGTSFHSDEYVVNVIPTDDPDQRDSIYVTGPSGSGKSCWISKFIGEYCVFLRKCKNSIHNLLVRTNPPPENRFRIRLFQSSLYCSRRFVHVVPLLVVFDQ